MQLPIEFIDKMKRLLGDEYEDYLKSYDMPRYYGLRVNTLKNSLEKWQKLNPFTTTKKVPWCEEGFYYTDDKPTKHPYYYAGLYYIQEPSAMAPGAYIPIEAGDKVLDLCAAPGGKSTQVAAKLGQKGLLVSNDISTTRAKALLKNMENFGVCNMIVTNESPERLAGKCPGYFDKILIDAPCSGEGMFRKQETAIKSWETHGVERCMTLQREILEHAARMLKTDGMVLYSTCTFSPEENEGMIEEFLTNHPEFEIVPLQAKGGIKYAHPEWVGARNEIAGALRLWPHHLEGEGHFVCLLQKKSNGEDCAKRMKVTKTIHDYSAVSEFMENYTTIDLNTKVIEINEKIYVVPQDAPDLSGLRIIRTGLLLGELKNKRFTPSQAMVLGYAPKTFKKKINFSLEDENVMRYLKGETILKEAEKGYHVVCVDGYPLGWVKAHNNTLKNQYPPTWRMMG